MSEPDGPQWLRVMRVRNRMTQEQLAGSAAIHVRTIRNLESGRIRRPRRATLDALASVLGMNQTDREDFVSTWLPLIDQALPLSDVVHSANTQLNKLALSAMNSAAILALSEVVRVNAERRIKSWLTEEVIEARIDHLQNRTVIYQPLDPSMRLDLLQLRGLENCAMEGARVFQSAGAKLFRLNLGRTISRGDSHLLRYCADFDAARVGGDDASNSSSANEAISGFLRPPRSYVLEVRFTEGTVPRQLMQVFQPAMDAPVRVIQRLQLASIFRESAGSV